jgi:hypothetical protein
VVREPRCAPVRVPTELRGRPGRPEVQRPDRVRSDSRELACHRRADSAVDVGHRVLLRIAARHERWGRHRCARVGGVYRARDADSAVPDPRAGAREHVAGVQPMGREEHLPIQQHGHDPRDARLVRPAARVYCARDRSSGSTTLSAGSSARATTSRIRPTSTPTSTPRGSSSTGS